MISLSRLLSSLLDAYMWGGGRVFTRHKHIRVRLIPLHLLDIREPRTQTLNMRGGHSNKQLLRNLTSHIRLSLSRL